MYIKRNIIFELENRKKNGVLIVENVPIRMRVTYNCKRVEFVTGYRIDVRKWDAEKQKVRNGYTNKVHPTLMQTYWSYNLNFRMCLKSLKYRILFPALHN